MTDWQALHLALVQALEELAPTLEAHADAPVPATPEWDVHDVLAHLAGGAADHVTGRLDGAPGPGWTHRHVEERREDGVRALLAELAAHGVSVREQLGDSPRPASVWDLAVHTADLHEALGLGRPASGLWAAVTHAVAPALLSGVPRRFQVGAARYGAGAPGDDELLELDEYELFRGAFSRRSRSQMAAWCGGALDAATLDGLCVFGPREDDQPVPTAPPEALSSQVTAGS
ncbi:maleylpyruvate isomerase N-terminal domain-containing protein [Nocardioides sp. GY 10127]|uniref:maleylpyruvate isomerase N-terminal domain-containing protein n=1 Tax=Nocardioides sp. GY 10127 TaxID=2569762 RepID=UPI0010A77100|nr:maleylpyruvate isomerase N-terminal domain-containing protein [Nocardioides sp. GY 10127]TIC82841.1 hypothetical protein E8D37_09240 [Nocardioides sp. GY 10127]